jgi:hypothetical protein
VWDQGWDLDTFPPYPYTIYTLLYCKLGVTDVDDVVRSREASSSQCSSNPHVKTSYESTGKLLLICICNFHVLSYLLLIYIRKLHWNSLQDRSKMMRAFTLWSRVLPLQYKTIELECQMKERIMTISALRDNYLRDVISVKYHIDKVRGNSSGVYICNSVVNNLRHGNYIDTNKQLTFGHQTHSYNDCTRLSRRQQRCVQIPETIPRMQHPLVYF